jgi:hypothetical protein
MQLLLHSVAEVQGCASSVLHAPFTHVRPAPQAVPSAMSSFATQTGAAVLHEMIPVLHG